MSVLVTPAVVDQLDEVIDRSASVRWDDLDATTQDATLRAVFDALGIAGGGSIAPSVRATLEVIAATAGRGEIVVPGWDTPLPPAEAAMALSLLIHAWDFDDTHDAAVIHACTAAVPAAYATAVHAGRSGRAMLEGVVAGTEVILRLSLLLGPQPGVIRTAGLGSLGAAAAASRVLGLSPEATRAALSLATPLSMSPTSRQVVEDGAISKRHQPGFGVRHGVTSAFLAQAGIAGAEGWFTGTYGLQALIDESDESVARAGRPGWEIARVSLKPYPACRYTHAAIAGTVELTDGAPATRVERVEVHVPEGAAHVLVSRPWARRGIPIIDAQFSIPWLVGAVLEHGRVDLEVISGPALMDPVIEDRARRVEVVQDRVADDSGMTPVTVTLVLDDGSRRSVEILDAPGSPTRPLDWDAIAAKAAGCARAAGLEDDTTPLRTWVQYLPAATVVAAPPTSPAAT